MTTRADTFKKRARKLVARWIVSFCILYGGFWLFWGIGWGSISTYSEEQIERAVNVERDVIAEADKNLEAMGLGPNPLINDPDWLRKRAVVSLIEKGEKELGTERQYIRDEFSADEWAALAAAVAAGIPLAFWLVIQLFRTLIWAFKEAFS